MITQGFLMDTGTFRVISDRLGCLRTRWRWFLIQISGARMVHLRIRIHFSAWDLNEKSMSTSPEEPQTIRNYLERLRIDQEPLWDHQRAGIYRYILIHKNIHNSGFYNNRLHIYNYLRQRAAGAKFLRFRLCFYWFSYRKCVFEYVKAQNFRLRRAMSSQVFSNQHNIIV